MRIIVTIAAVAVLLAFGFFLKVRADGRSHAMPQSDMDGLGALTARGTLVLSTFSDQPSDAVAPALHRSTFVNGPGYSGMEDNDLRGHLDGTFKYAWNQPTQVHVRVGRRNTNPRYGEFEIFRVLERWDGIHLPQGARVRNARIRMKIEKSAPDTVAVMLYEVKREWRPGMGGTLHDNVSPPNPGEVWWNDAAYRETSWGLPGAGYASDSDPNADTGAMPLAETIICPDSRAFTFESEQLAAYVDRRAQEGAPLLFLLKAADAHEDTPGSLVNVYSGNHGDSRNIGRRPHLEIEWEAGSEASALNQRISLERGRVLVLPPFPLQGSKIIAASFIPDSSTFIPTIQYRTGTGSDAGMWSTLSGLSECEGEWAQVRVFAAHDPIYLGEPFHADIRDTWIRTNAPEKQKVPWVFISPTGERHKRMANYVGDSRWVIAFVPDEIGLWRYQWSQHFADDPYQSEMGYFDVLGGELESLQTPLEKIAQAARVRDPQKLDLMSPLMMRFARLERAAMAQLTPDIYRSDTGEDLRASLRRTRVALAGHRVPDSIPMVPDSPPDWAQKLKK